MGSRSSRTIWVLWLSLVIALLIPVWILMRPVNSRDKENPTPPPPPPRVRLVILGEDSSNLKAISEIAPQYTKATGVDVDVVKQQFGDLQTIADSALQHGSAAYDIILNYNFSLATYVRHDWVYTLSELKKLAGDANAANIIEGDLIPSAWKEVGFYPVGAGPDTSLQPIGYPFATNTMLLCYNKKLFEDQDARKRYRATYHEELQPPADWTQFAHIAEFFSDKRRGTFGVALQGSSDGFLYYEWANFAFSMGGGVMRKQWGWEGDQHTPLLLETPQTAAATTFYLNLKRFNAGDYLKTGAQQQRELMEDGNVAMAIMWSDFVWDLLYGDVQHHDDLFGFAPIPGEKSMLAGGIFYVNKKSSHPKEAAKLILWLMQRDHQVFMMRRGLNSGLRSVYRDAEVQKLPYAAALEKSLKRGVYMNEANLDAAVISEILTKHLQQMWLGKGGVESGLSGAADEIRRARLEIFKQRP